jgi:hypothetical protein
MNSQINLVLKKGKLVPKTQADKLKYQMYLRTLIEGTEVLGLFEAKGPEKTNAQLAKIHVCIKQIADFKGCAPLEFKNELKEMAGITSMDEEGNKILKSFKDCSKEELSAVIEQLIQVSIFLELNLENYLSE